MVYNKTYAVVPIQPMYNNIHGDNMRIYCPYNNRLVRNPLIQDRSHPLNNYGRWHFYLKRLTYKCLLQIWLKL